MIVLLFFFLSLIDQSYAAIKVDDIPSPDVDPMACGRTDPSFVCSPDGLLSDQVMGWFDVYAKDLRQKSAETPCGEGTAGYELGTAWIRKMEFRSGENKVSAAQRYATTLHDRWGIGHRDCNNGVMIFVSIDDRQMYISVGAGATGQLGNSDIDSVIEAMKSYLRDNNNDEALRAGTEEIGDILLSKRLSTGAIVGIVIGSMVGLGLIIWGLFYRFRSKTKEFDPEAIEFDSEANNQTGYVKPKKEYVSKLRKIEKQYKKAKKKKKGPKARWNQDSCPICLEDWTELEEDPDFFREVLSCGHEFCQSCLIEWYQKKDPQTKSNVKQNYNSSSSDETSSMDSAHSSNGGRRCPICRQVDYSEGETVDNPFQSPIQNAEAVPYYTRRRWYDDEMRFRMNSLHSMYPYWLTAAAVSSWHPHNGFHSCYPQGYSYKSDPVIPHHHHYHRSTFSPSSYYTNSTNSRLFGGGSSYGGSGHGSSWNTNRSHTSFGTGVGGFSSGGFGGGGFSGGGGGGGGSW